MEEISVDLSRNREEENPFAPLIAAFLASIDNAHSRRAYVTDLQDFFNGEPEAADVAMWLRWPQRFVSEIDRYLQRNQRRGPGKRLSSRTIQRRLQTVRRLVLFAESQRLVEGRTELIEQRIEAYRQEQRALEQWRQAQNSVVRQIQRHRGRSSVPVGNESGEDESAEDKRREGNHDGSGAKSQNSAEAKVQRPRRHAGRTRTQGRDGDDTDDARAFDVTLLPRLLSLTEGMRGRTAEVSAETSGTETRGTEAGGAERTQAVKNDAKRVQALRDAALLHLLARVALDRSQVCALRVGDFQISGDSKFPGRLTVPRARRSRTSSVAGQGRAEAVAEVPLDMATTKAVGRYLVAAGHINQTETPLLLSLDPGIDIKASRSGSSPGSAEGGFGLTAEGIYFLIRSYGEQLGQSDLSSRRLKQWAITAVAAEENGDLKQMAWRLPHLSQATLRRYHP